MTTNSLFEIISALPEFKKMKGNRLIKHRHYKGTLTHESYVNLFDKFGYYESVDWQKKKEKNKL